MNLPRLYGKWFVQKLLVEVFLDIMYQDHSHTMIVILWSSCAPHHLQHVCDREIYVPPSLTIIVLCSLDNYQVSGKVYSPC